MFDQARGCSRKATKTSMRCMPAIPSHRHPHRSSRCHKSRILDDNRVEPVARRHSGFLGLDYSTCRTRTPRPPLRKQWGERERTQQSASTTSFSECGPPRNRTGNFSRRRAVEKKKKDCHGWWEASQNSRRAVAVPSRKPRSIPKGCKCVGAFPKAAKHGAWVALFAQGSAIVHSRALSWRGGMG